MARDDPSHDQRQTNQKIESSNWELGGKNVIIGNVYDKCRNFMRRRSGI